VLAIEGVEDVGVDADQRQLLGADPVLARGDDAEPATE
jgi:hypothetical protein